MKSLKINALLIPMKSKNSLDIISSVSRSTLGANLNGCRLLVAVSGGQDSLALLHALWSLMEELSIELVIAHLNHKLRDQDSNSDAEFVSEIGKKLEIDCVIGSADVRSVKQNKKISLEEAARDCRYLFLSNTAIDQKVDAVALGHTATDQAETVLFNTIRGAGLKGISGMQEMSFRVIEEIKVPIFRPLLTITRTQTLEYCNQVGLRPRHDFTNNLEDFTRNRLRNHLIPALKEFNLNIENSLIRLASNAAEANDFIESYTNEVFEQYVVFEEDSITINNKAIQLKSAILNCLIIQALRRFNDGLRNVGQVHIHEIVSLMKFGFGKSINLPNGINAVNVGGSVILSVGNSNIEICIDGKYPMKIPGQTPIPGWRIDSYFENVIKSNFFEQDHKVVKVDKSLAEGPLWIRGWQDGDRMQPLGMKGTKKIQDIFVDRKIPKSKRKSLPIVCCEKGVIWVAGCGIADWARLHVNQKEALKLVAIEQSSI